jgi:hypothetical protein
MERLLAASVLPPWMVHALLLLLVLILGGETSVPPRMTLVREIVSRMRFFVLGI